MSALLGFLAAILLDALRAGLERKKAHREKQEHQIQQINAVISGLTFDIERLFHIVGQNILPHYRAAHAVYNYMMADFANDDHIHKVIQLQSREYPLVFETCPDTYLIEYDFAKELPFIIERDPELVKHSGWLIGGVREIKDITSRRNRNIEDAFRLTGIREGAHNLISFRIVIRTQARMATTECIVAAQLFDVLIRLANGLMKISQDYKISAKKSRFTLPPSLAETMKALREISAKIPIVDP